MTESQKRAESTRGRFEEWASNRGWDVRRCENGVYANSSTELLWIGWKAAVQPATCLTCKEPLSSNGLIAWCDNGHVWELPEHNHDKAQPCNCKACAWSHWRGIHHKDESEVFVHSLEKRHMSSWTAEEMQRYNKLTGQRGTKTALHEPCNDNDCEICAEERFRG